MADVKVALIGVGSYVFGPSVIRQAIEDLRLDGVHLAMMDINRESVERMAGLGRRMAEQLGVGCEISWHTDRDAAIDAADFVICSAAVQMQQRWRVDCEIIDRYCPDHWVTEFGGVAGISYSLRQMAFIRDLAEAMRRRCPKVWLLTSSNPLPRVCQTAHESGVPTVGFCSAWLGGLGSLWRLYHGKGLVYPFAEAIEAWDVTNAGVNHFTWMTAFRDRRTGADLMDDLRKRLASGGRTGEARSDDLARETGYYPLPHQGHYADFLPPQGPAPARHEPYHGTAEQRAVKMDQLRRIAAGELHWDELSDVVSWERPMDLVAAMAMGRPLDFAALNLVNRGQIPTLPEGVFVETPCRADGPGGPAPRTIELPATVLPYAVSAAEVTRRLVAAARGRSRATLHEAVDLDPTITDKAAGTAAIDACLEAHRDLVGAYG